MSSRRRQTIIGSLVIYIGFAIGLLNTYFFTKEGLFTKEEYGLTSIFIAVAALLNVLGMMGMTTFIFKFFHFYNDYLPRKKNDLLSWALLVGTVGYILVTIAGFMFKDLVVRKFGANSPLLITYYEWIFPMGFGLTIFSILEAYSWQLGKPIITSFLREVQWRLFTTFFIVLVIAGIIRYDVFIKLYSLAYLGIAIILFIYLVATKQIHFTFRVSKVTRRYFGTMLRFTLFIYFGMIIFTISQVFDTILIASVLHDGTAKAGIFSLAQIFGSIIQAPQRSIVAASVTHLSRAWKDKNLKELQRIYQRSSINQLIFASFLFILIALNYRQGITTFGLKEIYLDGYYVFLLIGLMRIVDMGTGVNAQIITTSNYWRFELVSGIVLLILMLPLSYILTVKYDIIGPGIANLISVSIYNIIRIVFLWKKFRLFPFTIKSLYTVTLAGACYTICYFLFRDVTGMMGLFLRSVACVLLFVSGVFYLKLSPDIQPVLQAVYKRLGLRKNQ
ncbi:MAG TPA: polysaccharide biosynthesis C-terminal domain-containing protein [Chitinophagaceae bacterium]|nr:polysaccharide biosynthesis C-terminal domain-containing protein [Chitinophagaceae bacterium]